MGRFLFEAIVAPPLNSRLADDVLTLMRAESRRATERAKAVLKPGDILTVASCPGQRKRSVRFVGWNGDRLVTRTRDDFHASTISKVNGVAMSFYIDPRPAEGRQP